MLWLRPTIGRIFGILVQSNYRRTQWLQDMKVISKPNIHHAHVITECHSAQGLITSEGAKRRICTTVTVHQFFCILHITVIPQYWWDLTIARSGDMYEDDSGTWILSLFIKCFSITNTSWQNFAVRISSVKTVSTCLRKLKVLWTNLILNGLFTPCDSQNICLWYRLKFFFLHLHL